jgi:uncharacterized membrane protein
VTVAVILALVSIGFLIFFIDHAARSIQADVILQRVTHDTLDAIRSLGRREVREADPADLPDGAGFPVESRRSGYIQAFDEGDLVDAAEAADVVIRMEHAIGDFVLPGEQLMTLWCASEKAEKLGERLTGSVVLGNGRTPHQDIELGVIELVDIAARALSPGINDPTTAMLAVDRLGEVLVTLSRHPGPPPGLAGRDGRLRLLMVRRSFEEILARSFGEVRHHGAGNPAIALKLLHVLGKMAVLLPPSLHPVLSREVNRIRRTVDLRVEHTEDRSRVLIASEAVLVRTR